MSHTAEGSLQTYLDGEMDNAAEAAVRQHLAVCDACARELESLRALGLDASAAFALLADAPPPMVRAQAAIATARREAPQRSFARFTAGGFSKAAMLLLALTGAVAAAIPGSPVRRAIESTIARLFSVETPAVAVPATTPAAGTPGAVVMEENEVFVPAANGAVRILLHAPAGSVEVTVRLVDAELAQVQTSSDSDVRFRSANGRLEVVGLGGGTVTIGVPRGLDAVRVEVNGTLHAFKANGMLRLSGPAGTGQGSEVKFRIVP